MDDADVAPGLSSDEVVWAYRLLLGRDPESDDTIAAYRTLADRQTLVGALITSDEFHERNPKALQRNAELRLSTPMSVETTAEENDLVELTRRVAETWRQLGWTAPHWSTLPEERFLPSNINGRRREFFASGADDADRLLAILRYLGRQPGEFTTLTEFGCGLARVTSHLARRFPRVVGCDISASHLELARERIREENLGNVTLRDVTAPDFGMAESVDLWVSYCVLQHNPPPLIGAILAKMLSRLNPGGLAIFQLPTYRRGYDFKLADYLAPKHAGQIEMHVMPVVAVTQLVKEAYCSVLDILDDHSAGPGLISNVFVIGR